MCFFRSLGPQLAVAFMALLLAAAVPSSQAKPFIDPSSYDIKAILPPPPAPGSEQYRIDTGFLKNARAASTQEQIDRGNKASHDSVFDYSETLGDWFNAKDLPKTAALFKEVTGETKESIELAKHYFNRTRPESWKESGDLEKSDGYAYPSGHTTRAFVWYRVILGRHFPADVRAGKLYGQFLAKQFLKNPGFLAKWSEACEEMHEARKAAHTEHHDKGTGLTPDGKPAIPGV
jgi:acid phosphatase (class A)